MAHVGRASERGSRALDAVDHPHAASPPSRPTVGRHALLYALARGIPGLVLLASIALYTRLVPPAEYGLYALVVLSVNVANIIIFQWLRIAVLRFLPAREGDLEAFKATVLTCYGACALVAVGCAAVAAPATGEPRLVAMGLGLLMAQAWFELNLEWARAELRPFRYGAINFAKAALALAVGALLALRGMGGLGLLLGLGVGMAVPAAASSRSWLNVRPRLAAPAIRNELVRYGLPLTITFALGFVLAMSDRLMLAWFLDEEAVGLYAVGYDLPRQSMGMLMMVVNLAAFPLAIRAMESGDTTALRAQLNANAAALVSVAAPLCVLFVLLRENIAHVVLGDQYGIAAAQVIPWIAVGALLEGAKSYYMDHSFHLSKQTRLHASVTGIAMLMNVLLNALWIPRFGILGAAYSTVVSYAVAIALSWAVGRSVLKMPIPWRIVVQVLLCCAVMASSLLLLGDGHGLSSLVLRVAIGGLTYVVALAALNVGGIRDRAWRPGLRSPARDLA